MSEDKDAVAARFKEMKARVSALGDEGMELLFTEARTCYGWLDKKVPEAMLHRIVELALLAPTSANTSPARYVFVSSDAAKERLKPCLSPGNVEKTMPAPTTAIIAYDVEFWRHMDRLFPHGDMKSMFEKSEAAALDAAFRNGSLMGAYTILAARALGLDCGPMSGFDKDKVNAEFFEGTSYKANFLCNIGYGDPSTVKPRGPKFGFDEIASII